jgi:hypothetical protein
MKLDRLMVCTMAGISLLSIAASASDHARKGPFKASPLAATHHASYSKVSKAPVLKADKPARKPHFWSR